MTYSTVLFDFDHTLFDTDGAEAPAFDTTIAQLGLAPNSDHFDAYREINLALWDSVHAGTLAPSDVHLLRFEQWVDRLGLDAEPQRLADVFLLADDPVARRLGIEQTAHRRFGSAIGLGDRRRIGFGFMSKGGAKQRADHITRSVGEAMGKREVGGHRHATGASAARQIPPAPDGRDGIVRTEYINFTNSI